MPLARPAIAALAVFAFLAAWNQYLWPLLVTKDDRLRTVQIGLQRAAATRRSSTRSTSRSPASCIAVLPLVILLLLFQKQLVRGPHRRRREGLSDTDGTGQEVRRVASPDDGAQASRAQRASRMVVVAVGLVAVGGGAPRRAAVVAPSARSSALKNGERKPVEITYWHSMTRANEETLQR